jgi:Flp pilus assembly protein protease CpaA
LLVVSLFFTWEDLQEQAISSWIFVITFCLFLSVNFEQLEKTYLFFILALLANLIDIGIGEGDFCILAMYSLHYDIYECVVILFLSSFIGLFFSISISILRKKWLNKIPLIPFITISLVIYHSYFTRF